MKRFFLPVFISVFIVISQLGCSQSSTHFTPIIAAGVPKTLAESGDFQSIFQTLSEAGMTVFLPTFQYQEVLEAKSLSLDHYFMPPCQPLSGPLTAMLQAKISMIVPGGVYYPQWPDPFPTLKEDPLQALVACLGDKGIYGVYSYDEPVAQGVSLESVKRLYEHVKSIDPNLPVLMIHAPLVLDVATMQTPEQRAAYLKKVKDYSQYADSVGFDVYPIPSHITQLATPYSDDPTRDYRLVIEDYLQWLKTELPSKHHALVLQGFSYTHLYEDAYLERNIPADQLALVRPPSREELEEMVKVVERHNAQVIWWGQSHLEEEDMALWNDMLLVSKQAR